MWTPRRVAIGWALLAIWVVAVAIWATRPATDHVPTGVVDGQATSLVVECNAPLDGSPGPAEPLPAIEAPRALQHIPCEAQHRSNRISLLIDALVAVAAATLLVVGPRRQRARAREDEPQPVTV